MWVAFVISQLQVDQKLEKYSLDDIGGPGRNKDQQEVEQKRKTGYGTLASAGYSMMVGWIKKKKKKKWPEAHWLLKIGLPGLQQT